MKPGFVAFCVVVCGAVLITAALEPVRAAVPCCEIKKTDASTRIVTLTEKATGCTYEVKVNNAKDLKGLRVGGSFDIDLKVLAPLTGPTIEMTGQAASSCGSNVPRDANTKEPCIEMTGPNSWKYVPCPKK
jgi:hypothetical protein